MGGVAAPQYPDELFPFLLCLPLPFFFFFSLPVTDFSNKTRDYPGLSVTNLQVLALTCHLQAETNGPGCLCWDPQEKLGLCIFPRDGAPSSESSSILVPPQVWLSSVLWHPKAPPTPHWLLPALQGKGQSFGAPR